MRPGSARGLLRFVVWSSVFLRPRGPRTGANSRTPEVFLQDTSPVLPRENQVKLGQGFLSYSIQVKCPVDMSIQWRNGLGGTCCNPSYSGARDLEDQGWRPAQAKKKKKVI
jgi:hypothetical protein